MTHFDLTGYRRPRRSTVGSFVANLPEMLGVMATDPRTIVAIAQFSDGRYWQCRAEKDSTIVMEVVSNLNISEGATALSELEERRLRDMGFMVPSVGPKPNWRVESAGICDLMRLVSLTRTAVYDILHESPQNIVEMCTWEYWRPTS
jgi:hypothetical protein